jgi:hypothetical protein
MVLSSIFESFVNERPVCVMARGVLERLLDPTHIDSVFENTAETQYTKNLLFSSLVNLMSAVVLKVQPSVNAAYQSQQEDLNVSTTALYNKLNRVETTVSAELVCDSARQATPVIDALGGRCQPWLPGFRCKVLDGNHLAATEHRIEELRTIREAPLPGKSLVVLHQELMLITDVFLTEDGYRQERDLLEEVLPSVEPDDLWIGDRNFCTCRFLSGIAKRGGYYVIRQHGALKGELLGQRKSMGHTETGEVYEQEMLIPDPDTNGQQRIRRITVQLKKATRDGDREIHLLSNVPTRIDAGRLSDLYRRRWTIETAFAEITETLSCEINTLGYPPAALFAFCLALLAYNAVSLLKASLRAVHGEEKVTQHISSYYLTLEIRQTYDGMMIAIPAPHWQIFRDMTAEELAGCLKEIAAQMKLSRYQKHPRGPKKKQPKRKSYGKGGHVSTARVLETPNDSC